MRIHIVIKFFKGLTKDVIFLKNKMLKKNIILKYLELLYCPMCMYVYMCVCKQNMRKGGFKYESRVAFISLDSRHQNLRNDTFVNARFINVRNS